MRALARALTVASVAAIEPMTTEEVIVLLASVPERVTDLVAALDESQLAYRHAPAFPTLIEVINHLCTAGGGVDALLRQAYLDRQRDLPVRATIQPGQEVEPVTPSVVTRLQDFARVRRRTVDLLRGLKPDDWQQPIVDPDQGELTLLEACSMVARHELAHLSQVRNLVALLP